MKISIIGAGKLGSTIAYTLAMQNLGSELTLIDTLHPDLAKGHCLDIQHALSMVGNMKIFSGGYETTADADIIIIAAGMSRKSGETRMDVTGRNVEITREVISNVLDYNQKAILILTNTPIDIMTYVALKASSFPRERVIGSGTFLDSVRFRYLLSEIANLNPNSIQAILLGEHGDSAVPILSTATVNGIPIVEASGLSIGDLNRVIQKAKASPAELLALKGGSMYAPSLAMAKIVKSIISNQHKIMPVSVYVQGEYGLEGLCLSLPVKLGRNGVEEIIEIKLTEEERRQLDISAGIIKSEINTID